jgi:alkanesulfonate monooxygenase SsuD/methylene tetrahydromethanopterin reductase-like flavin-dependent oxidoreductase (luciferase family)
MSERLRFGVFDWIEASRRAPGEVYRHKLELAAAADPAGFHAYLIAEHQGTPLPIDGSPSHAALFQRTRRLRAGALTFCSLVRPLPLQRDLHARPDVWRAPRARRRPWAR